MPALIVEWRDHEGRHAYVVHDVIAKAALRMSIGMVAYEIDPELEKEANIALLTKPNFRGKLTP